MLKHRIGDSIRLITQPAHAALSGFLAAHWGNEAFTQPGFFAPAPDPKALRNEVLFGIAEHDNGWWEWEAEPEIDPQDGLPLHFLETDHASGHARWKRGAKRFSATRPYASLLINYHAHWLNEPSPPSEFGSFFPSTGDSTADPETEQFLMKLRERRASLQRTLQQTENGPAALRSKMLHPHVRLLQALDFVSLWLCGGANKKLDISGIPRQSWDDRIALSLEPNASGEIKVAPFPFDRDPLHAAVVCSVLPPATERPELRSVRPQVVVLTLTSR